MAARGSFQKRQKEAARREKRQLKLDRRQGRQPARTSSGPSTDEEPNDVESLTQPESPSDIGDSREA